MNDSHLGTFAALGNLISKTLASKRGLIVPGLGLFTYGASAVSLDGITNPKARDKDLRTPVFVVSNEFDPRIRPGISHATGVRPYTSTGHGSVPTVRLNYTELGLQLVTSKDEAKARLDKAILNLRQKINDGQDVRQEIPSVGTLVVRSKIAAVIFSRSVPVLESTVVTADAADWLKTNLEIDVYNLSNPPTRAEATRPKTVSNRVAQALGESKAQLDLLFNQKDGGKSGFLSWQDVWSCVQQLGRSDITEQSLMDWVNSLKAMANFKVRYEELLRALEAVKPKRPASSRLSLASQRTSLYDTSSLKDISNTIWEAKLALVSAASQPPNRPRVKVSVSELLQMCKRASIRTNVHQLKALVQNCGLDPLNVSMLNLITGARDTLKFDGRDLSVFSALESASSSVYGSPEKDNQRNLETYLRLVDVNELCESCKDHRGFLNAETFARKVADDSKGRLRYHEVIEGFKQFAEGRLEISVEAFKKKYGISTVDRTDIKHRVKEWLKVYTGKEIFANLASGSDEINLEAFKSGFRDSGIRSSELETLFREINTSVSGSIDEAQVAAYFDAKRPSSSAGYFQKATDDAPTLSAPPPAKQATAIVPPVVATTSPIAPALRAKSSTISQRTSNLTSSLWGGDDPLRRLQSLIRASPHNINEFFDEMDTDSNGKISAVEFRNAIRRLKLGLTSREIDELLRRIDTNNDGQIDFAEFCKKFHVAPVSHGDQMLHKRLAQYAKLMNSVMLSPKDAFKQFDTTRSDRLDFDSFTAMFNRLTKIGNLKALTQTDLRGLFNLIDIRQDGIIDMREWLNTFRMSSNDMWEDSKQYEEVSKHIAKHRKLLLKMFEEKSVDGHILASVAKDLLAPVLEVYRLKEEHWRRLLAVAERQGAIDYRLFLDIYKDRAVGAQMHPKP
mmetsp:Transcript_27355/g.49237  ORF Transcript_27355/g.49237 Transcript_27355/m.49237 type:complete len:905 (+) Transcript_27355:55-2769(+)